MSSCWTLTRDLYWCLAPTSLALVFSLPPRRCLGLPAGTSAPRVFKCPPFPPTPRPPPPSPGLILAPHTGSEDLKSDEPYLQIHKEVIGCCPLRGRSPGKHFNTANVRTLSAGGWQEVRTVA